MNSLPIPALLGLLFGLVFVLVAQVRRYWTKLDGPLVLVAVAAVSVALVLAFDPWAGWAHFGRDSLIVFLGALFTAEATARGRAAASYAIRIVPPPVSAANEAIVDGLMAKATARRDAATPKA